MVGVAGFEPATSCSQSRRDDRATLHPEYLHLILLAGEKNLRLSRPRRDAMTRRSLYRVYRGATPPD